MISLEHHVPGPKTGKLRPPASAVWRGRNVGGSERNDHDRIPKERNSGGCRAIDKNEHLGCKRACSGLAPFQLYPARTLWPPAYVEVHTATPPSGPPSYAASEIPRTEAGTVLPLGPSNKAMTNLHLVTSVSSPTTTRSGGTILGERGGNEEVAYVYGKCGIPF